MPSHFTLRRGRGSKRDYLAATDNNRNRRLGYITGGAVKNPRSRTAKVIHTIKKVLSGNLATKIKNIIPSSDSNARKQYPGEMHTLLKTGKWMGIANYMGPGTDIVTRIKNDDPPRTLADKVAQVHDIRYALDPTKAKEADHKMVESLEQIKRDGTDHKVNVEQGLKVMRAKMLANDLGVLPKDAFTGSSVLAQSDRDMLQKKLASLEQEGYGFTEGKRPKPNHIPGKRLLKRLTRLEHKKGKGATLPGDGKGVTLPGDGKGVTLPGDGKGVTLPGDGKGRISIKDKAMITNSIKGRGMYGGAISSAIPSMVGKLGLTASDTSDLQKAVKSLSTTALTVHQATRKAGQTLAPLILAKIKDRLKLVKNLPKSDHHKLAIGISKGLKAAILNQDGSGWDDMTAKLSKSMKVFIARNKKQIVKKVLDVAPESLKKVVRSVGADPEIVAETLVSRVQDSL